MNFQALFIMREDVKDFATKKNIYGDEKDIMEFARYIWESAWNRCVKHLGACPEEGIVRLRDKDGTPIIGGVRCDGLNRICSTKPNPEGLLHSPECPRNLSHVQEEVLQAGGS
jgi:hypothetical protein